MPNGRSAQFPAAQHQFVLMAATDPMAGQTFEKQTFTVRFRGATHS